MPSGTARAVGPYGRPPIRPTPAAGQTRPVGRSATGRWARRSTTAGAPFPRTVGTPSPGHLTGHPVTVVRTGPVAVIDQDRSVPADRAGAAPRSRTVGRPVPAGRDPRDRARTCGWCLPLAPLVRPGGAAPSGYAATVRTHRRSAAATPHRPRPAVRRRVRPPGTPDGPSRPGAGSAVGRRTPTGPRRHDGLRAGSASAGRAVGTTRSAGVVRVPAHWLTWVARVAVCAWVRSWSWCCSRRSPVVWCNCN